MTKPAKCGLDYVRGPGWEPARFTRRGVQRYAARNNRIPGFFTPVIADCGDYWRINYGGGPTLESR